MKRLRNGVVSTPLQQFPGLVQHVSRACRLLVLYRQGSPAKTVISWILVEWKSRQPRKGELTDETIGVSAGIGKGIA